MSPAWLPSRAAEPPKELVVADALPARYYGSHALARDGTNIVTACLLDAEPPRLVHGMAVHRLMELPIRGRAARRIGAVDGTRPSCIGLLNAGAVVLAFPEGIRALTRGFR